MKRNTHKPLDFTVRIIFTAIILIAAVIFTYCAVADVFSLENGSSFVIMIVTFVCAAFAWGVMIYSLRRLAMQVNIDETGLAVKRFGKKVVSIDWNDIKEIGVGQATVTNGNVKKLYFAKRPLTDEEKLDLDKVQKETVYFSFLSKKWLDYIKEHCNAELPEEAEELFK